MMQITSHSTMLFLPTLLLILVCVDAVPEDDQYFRQCKATCAHWIDQDVGADGNNLVKCFGVAHLLRQAHPENQEYYNQCHNTCNYWRNLKSVRMAMTDPELRTASQLDVSSKIFSEQTRALGKQFDKTLTLATRVSIANGGKIYRWAGKALEDFTRFMLSIDTSDREQMVLKDSLAVVGRRLSDVLVPCGRYLVSSGADRDAFAECQMLWGLFKVDYGRPGFC